MASLSPFFRTISFARKFFLLLLCHHFHLHYACVRVKTLYGLLHLIRFSPFFAAESQSLYSLYVYFLVSLVYFCCLFVYLFACVSGSLDNCKGKIYMKRRQPKWDSNKSNGEEFSIANYCCPCTHSRALAQKWKYEQGNKNKKKKKTTAIYVESENLNFGSIHSTYLIGFARFLAPPNNQRNDRRNSPPLFIQIAAIIWWIEWRWRERKTRKFSSCLISIRVRRREQFRNLHIKCWCWCCCYCRHRCVFCVLFFHFNVVYSIFMFPFSLHLISQISHFRRVLCVCALTQREKVC